MTQTFILLQSASVNNKMYFFFSEYSDNIAKGSIPVQAYGKIRKLLARYVKSYLLQYNSYM